MRKIKRKRAGIKRYQKLKYESKYTAIQDEEVGPILLPKNKIYSYPIQGLRFYAGAEKFIFFLSSLEFKLLYYLILSMDFNFLVKSNSRFKEKFRDFLLSLSDPDVKVKDSSVLNSLTKFRKLKILIPLKTEPHQHMINPLYFSKSYCNRKAALKFLLEAELLPKDETLKKRYDSWSEFNGIEKSEEKKFFSLIPQEILRKINERKPKSEFDLWLERE